ncbi:uncharacterized protein B0H18DRAFT_979547 [Fomitopsis serialis]|uniref:uncharacterized protein n=1 Tax=Fomitopsis serialis TaxID=139415 RepID=UPI0020089CA1|nr:uncharacterized protein B0H18DRAFT_1053241 [Neoantrodia serialis]XP_047898190.1 uncharacterized protein B0H18DRAFT_979547 [Neoantrodia serialis]KAH9912582.1 hypothetical protein B0H18DRAFT_1053241 [Neoantrodia serialis]KAH9934124.1 hypothetical protein B0H18DRAFT_979547 [Neoantrodia serialis]
MWNTSLRTCGMSRAKMSGTACTGTSRCCPPTRSAFVCAKRSAARGSESLRAKAARESNATRLEIAMSL